MGDDGGEVGGDGGEDDGHRDDEHRDDEHRDDEHHDDGDHACYGQRLHECLHAQLGDASGWLCSINETIIIIIMITKVTRIIFLL